MDRFLGSELRVLCVSVVNFVFHLSFLANFWMHFLTVRLRFLPEIPLTLPILSGSLKANLPIDSKTLLGSSGLVRPRCE
jgi:hypothetical protein